MANEWMDEVRARLPDWQSPEALARWPSNKSRLSIGQRVRGIVIACAPFGVWLDIGAGHPALLHMIGMTEAPERRIEDYPAIGETIEARIAGLSDRAEIFLMQNSEGL